MKIKKILKRKRQKRFNLDYAGLLILSLAALPLLLMTLTGCAAKKIILHPIEGTDIVPLTPDETKKECHNYGMGEVCIVPANVPAKKGYFISDFYLEQVMKAKVE